jgi:4-amino-4-deoxy-L-arabinose transferase-like glycosyltransferase
MRWASSLFMQTSFVSDTDAAVRRHRVILFGLWVAFYCSFTLFTPALLDDADSVHAEVAREMVARHDWVTLYANGIRYLEKAPVLYWSMAASFSAFGVHTFTARLPLAFTVLAMVLAMEAFGRWAFGTARAGLYAGLILLSSFGIFIFTRITIPDVMVCLWLTLALLCYWVTEQQHRPRAVLCWGFAACCALDVLTKGLIGIVFPVAIVTVHLGLTRRSWRGVLARIRQMSPVSSALIFLGIAVPWHVLIGLANPTQGHPGGVALTHGHWTVPLPTYGNVHGWVWFYFVNEQVLRYLNLRVPRDYDTVPLVLFWGLLLVWLMPWSGFLWGALGRVPWGKALRLRVSVRTLDAGESTRLLLGIWALLPLLFFSLSTRQEYYVLPAMPALMLLVAGWLNEEAAEAEAFAVPNPMVRSGIRISTVLLGLGSAGALVAGFFAVFARTPGPNVDLASLLRQNPGDYALSFGHFLDLNAQAMGVFRTPLLMTAVALFGGTLASWLCRRAYRPHAGNLWLAGATFVFLLAAHIGLQTFAPVLSSRALAGAIAPRLRADDLIVIHGEYESASTLGFYLRRNDLHILEGRSSNLWYGSFFPDAPPIFEDAVSMELKWTGTRRVFLWQDLGMPLPVLRGKTYLIAQSGGKEILRNQPDPF